MKFICNRDCQAELEGQITFIKFGQVVEAEKNPKPTCFGAIGTEDDSIDFTTAGEDALNAGKWTFAEAKAAVKKAYGITLVKKSGETKGDIVSKILDARYRQVS